MAKSVFSGFERFSTKFEDVEDGASVEAEVTVDVSVADGEAEATEIAETVAESEQIVEAVEEGENTAETLRFYASVARQYGVSPAFLAVVNADNGLSNLSGIVLPSSESLDTTGRNQSTAEQVIRACEAAEKSVWERVKEFFKRLWEQLKTLGRTILNKFSSWESACKRACESIQNITIKDKTDDKEIVTPAQISSTVVAFTELIKNPLKPNKNHLGSIGLKEDEDGAIVSDSNSEVAKPTKTKIDNSLRESLIKCYTNSIVLLFKQKNTAESTLKENELSIKNSISNAEKLARMTEDTSDKDEIQKIKDSNEETKKQVKITMKALGLVGKIAGAYVKSCAACRAAKA